MRKSVKSIDKILPHGESIRGFLNQSFLTESDLKLFLRNRGVFLSDYSKPTSVPFLTSTLISPEEFDSLKESQGTREDNPKRTNEVLQWESNKSLKEAINENKLAIINQLIPQHCHYRLLNAPQITLSPSNDNEVKIAFEIERDDLNKSWFESKNGFKAEIILNLDTTKKQLRITKTHTSDETKQVINSFTKNLMISFVDRGYIDKNKKVETILFSDFDNANRFYFLFTLAKQLDDSSISVEFKDIIDIEFKPDSEASMPDSLKWMKDKSKVILKGKEVHNTDFFLKAENYHLLVIWSVEAVYKFNMGGVIGSLTLQIGFQEYSRGENTQAELIITPTKCNIVDRSHIMKRTNLTKRLMDEIDKIKFDTYDKFKTITSVEPALVSD